jgi:hypothetical protein
MYPMSRVCEKKNGPGYQPGPFHNAAPRYGCTVTENVVDEVIDEVTESTPVSVIV